MDKKRVRKNAYLLLITLVLLIGGSYAWFSLTIDNSKTNVVRAGNLKLSLVDCEKDLILKNAVPVSDSKGMQSEICTFKVENTGKSSIDYSVYLDDTDKEGISNEKRMKDKYVKYWLTKNDIVRSQGMGTVKFVEGGYTGTFDPASHKFVHVVGNNGSEVNGLANSINSKLDAAVPSGTATFNDGVEAFKSMFGTNNLTYETQEPADAKILGTKVIGIGTIKFVEGNYTATFDTSTHKFTSIVDSSGSEQTSMLSGVNAKLGEDATFDDGVEAFKSLFSGNYTFEVTEPIDPVALNSREIDTTTIKENQTDTYKLRVWINQDADNGVMGTIFAGKIRIEATQTKPAVANLKAIDKTQTISGVVFQVVDDNPTTTANEKKSAKVKTLDNKNSSDVVKVASMKSQAAASYDVSVEQDKSVMQYNVLNQDGKTYTAYIEAKTKITAPEDSSSLLAIDTATSITGLENLDTSKVVNMRSFFNGVKATSLDISSLDTSNVTNMAYMFYYTKNLSSIDLSHLNTSKVTDMSGMFADTGVTTLDLSKLKTSNVTNMFRMFYETQNLTNVNLSNLNTSKVTNMFQMFYASAIPSIDLNGLDTSSLENMGQMFANTHNLETVDLSPLNLSNVTSAEVLLNESNVKELDLTGISWDKLNSDSFNLMFTGAKKLEVLNANNMSLQKVTSIGGYSDGFGQLNSIKYLNMKNLDAPSLTTIHKILPCGSCSSNVPELADLSGLNAPNLTTLEGAFKTTNVKNVNLSNIKSDNLNNLSELFKETSYLENVNLEGTDTSKVTNISYMFNDSGITSFDFSQLDTSSVTNIIQFLFGTTRLTSADLSSFDLSQATNGSYVFTNSNIENLDMHGVTAAQIYYSDLPSKLKKLDMSDMNIKYSDGGWYFYQMSKLESVDLSNTTLNSMKSIQFSGLSSLKTVNMENFYAPDCNSINTIFAGTSGLTNLNISGLNMPSLKDVSYMFKSSGLTGTLDLSSINTPEVENASHAFEKTKFSSINLSSWVTPKLSSLENAFTDDTLLETVNLANCDFSSLTSMKQLFYGNSALSEVNVNGIKTGSLVDISQMFDGTTALTSFDFKKLDLSTVTNMIGVVNASGITSINLDNVDLSSLETLNRVFSGATNLKTFSMKNAKAASVIDIRGMFDSDTSLTSVDMSGTTIEVVEHIDQIFKDCSSLDTVDISGISLSTDVSCGEAFSGAKSGVNVKVKDATAKSFIEDVFTDSGITGTAVIA